MLSLQRSMNYALFHQYRDPARVDEATMDSRGGASAGTSKRTGLSCDWTSAPSEPAGSKAVVRPTGMELRIERLSKRYPTGVQALRDVSLTIGPGMFGLLGPNGAGKSTLMRTLATLQEPDAGTATLGDIDVLRDKDATRRVLGYLPQEFGVYPKVAAEELLDHLAALKGITNGKERRDVVHALLQQTNLFDVRKKPLGSFSGGMKQRFGIAQALLGKPRLVIVDEPTAGLDPEERVRFHNLLGAIGDDVIVILSTHIVGDVIDLCRDMAILYRGEVLMTGDPARAVAALEGRVWQKTIETGAEVADPVRGEATRSSRRASSPGARTGCASTRRSARTRPSSPSQADLEDVYFAAIKGFARPQAPRARVDAPCASPGSRLAPAACGASRPTSTSPSSSAWASSGTPSPGAPSPGRRSTSAPAARSTSTRRCRS